MNIHIDIHIHIYPYTYTYTSTYTYNICIYTHREKEGENLKRVSPRPKKLSKNLFSLWRYVQNTMKFYETLAFSL